MPTTLQLLCLSLLAIIGSYQPYMKSDQLAVLRPIDYSLTIDHDSKSKNNSFVKDHNRPKNTYTISGKVESLTYGVYIRDVKCEAIAGSLITADITNLAGEYKFVNLPAGQDYLLTFEKLDNDPLCGISWADITDIERHIRGKQRFMHAWQYLAADVSGDQRITVLDIVRIRALMELGEALPNPWTFLPVTRYANLRRPPWPYDGSLQFENLSEDKPNRSVYAIKGGDVNGRGCATPEE